MKPDLRVHLDAEVPSVRAATRAADEVEAPGKATEPVHVLHVLSPLYWGGVETLALDLCRAIPPEDAAQTFVTLGCDEEAVADRFRQLGARLERCPAEPAATFAIRLWRTIRRNQPDVVTGHIGLSNGLVALVAKLCGVPTRIAHLHTAEDNHADTARRRLMRAVLRRAIRYAATDVIGVSGAAIAYAAPRPDDTRYRVVYNGVDAERLNSADGAAIRLRYGIPADAPVLLHLGRAAPVKNRPFLLDVLRSAILREPEARLIFVGAGGDADLSAACPELYADPRIIVNGPVADVGPFLAAADVLLLPSRHEGLGNVVLEALACGVPVLASDLPTMREIAVHAAGLTLLDLDEGASAWARATIDLVKLSRHERHQIRQALLASPFTVQRFGAEVRALWRIPESASITADGPTRRPSLS